MPKENVEIVRSLNAPWMKGDFSSSEWADAEIEFSTPNDRTMSRGVAAMARRWSEWMGAWEDFASSPEKFVDAGDQVVVMNRFRGRGKGSGTPLTDFPGAAVFTLREGKVVRLNLYTNFEEAMDAAGLSE
jgi:ketosteroid isomerase-like protein